MLKMTFKQAAILGCKLQDTTTDLDVTQMRSALKAYLRVAAKHPVGFMYLLATYAIRSAKNQ